MFGATTITFVHSRCFLQFFFLGIIKSSLEEVEDEEEEVDSLGDRMTSSPDYGLSVIMLCPPTGAELSPPPLLSPLQQIKATQ